MNKLMLTKGRAVASLILMCLFLVQSCKKDRKYLSEADSNKQLISTDVITKWQVSNPAAEYFALDWQKARQAQIQGKNVVRVPLINIDKISIIKGRSPKSNSNLNYNEKRPPEVFFIQDGQNGKLRTYLLNFIPKDNMPDDGHKGQQTGKLYEWNFSGDTIAVQNFEKGRLIEKYLVKYGIDPQLSDLNATVKQQKLQTISIPKNKLTSNIFTWLLDKTNDFIGWVGSAFGASTWISNNIYGQTIEDAGWRINKINWASVFSTGNMEQIDYIAADDYSGGGGEVYNSFLQYSDPNSFEVYPHGPNVVIQNFVADYVAGKFQLDYDSRLFLYSHLDVAEELRKYGEVHPIGQNEIEFIKWAVSYLAEDESRFNQAFKDLLTGTPNEYSPIYIPSNFDIAYPQEYFDIEDSYDALTLELVQEGLSNADPIPEMYYKNGTKIDMAQATPLNGRRTALGFPSNHRYFWKELIKLRPEMFDENNRTRILAGGSPVANDQWIKYNPTHIAYKDLPLRHHHEGQGRWAYAIPEKVHQKWSSILHSIKVGKFPKLKGTMNSLAGGMQIFSLLTDFNTGNPDAWLNWYGPVDQVGKVYKQPFSGDYFVITKQTKYMNSSGEVIRAKVTYDVYADYIWDSDEQKYMGVLKLGTFTENVDMNNRWSTDPVWEPRGL